MEFIAELLTMLVCPYRRQVLEYETVWLLNNQHEFVFHRFLCHTLHPWQLLHRPTTQNTQKQSHGFYRSKIQNVQIVQGS